MQQRYKIIYQGATYQAFQFIVGLGLFMGFVDSVILHAVNGYTSSWKYFKTIHTTYGFITDEVLVKFRTPDSTSAQFSCVTTNCDFTGKGANVILDCIGGRNWEQNVSSLATDGRWVLYGTMGGRAVEGDLLGKLLSKRGHLLSSLLRSRSLQVRIQTEVTCFFMSACSLCTC